MAKANSTAEIRRKCAARLNGGSGKPQSEQLSSTLFHVIHDVENTQMWLEAAQHFVAESLVADGDEAMHLGLGADAVLAKMSAALAELTAKLNHIQEQSHSMEVGNA